ncbi:MAG TPA: IclR family transcriptional regulator [Burkholderiales bacterium]|nr:IclR family transcriptional regulator [Burkholderiales bacterium]
MSTRKSVAHEEARYSAPALEKGLDVLELLAAEPHGLNQQEIARRLKRTANELFRMLDVLVRRGYLMRQTDSGYALTLRLFELAHRHPGVDRLLDCAMPHMQVLASQTGQSNHLCVHHDARLVVLAQAEPPEPMTCSVRQGAHFAFHDDRVSARVITAFQTGEQHDQYLSEVLGSPRAAPARKRALVARLDAIRRRGYDEGPSDTINGVVDICFPLFDRFGVIAALNIVYLKQRDSRVTIPAAKERLRHAAQGISKALGWLGC